MHFKLELIKALETDKAGNWDLAHRIVQDINTPEAAWIHAYLHRKEGDLGNASYWYSRANRSMPAVNLEQEWEEIYNYLSGDED